MDLCVCKICLTGEGRLYSMTKYDLYTFYENLTGLHEDAGKGLPQWICAECGLRLMAYNKLRQKSLSSHTFLLEMMKRPEYNLADIITLVDLEAINFKTNFIQTETDVFSFKPEQASVKSDEIGFSEEINDVEEMERGKSIIDDLLFDTDDVKSLVSNVGTENDYQEEYLQFSDELECEFTLQNEEAKKQFKYGEEMERILRENLINSLSVQDFENKGLTETESFGNLQFENVSTILNSDDEEKERDGFKCKSRSVLGKRNLSSESDLQEHIVGTTDSLQYTCSQCDFTTSVRSIAMTHRGKHVGKKHQCPHCNKQYSHRTSCANHIRNKHPQAGDSVCDQCGYSFINERVLRHHKRQRHPTYNHHQPLEGPQCPKCRITLASEEAYRMHLKVSFEHDDIIENTMKPRTRVPKNPIACEQCDVKCESARAYHKHFMSSHPDKTRTRYLFLVPTMCEICGRIFHNSTYLKEHLVVHKTGTNPYRCDVCTKTFALKLHLQMHKKIHDKNRPLHPCQLCDKLFANKQNLNKHVLIHTGEKPFECEACFKCFPTKDRMKSHYQYVHEKKPWPKRNRNRRKATSVRETELGPY